MKKALVLYWSATGNTEKVARSIAAGLAERDCSVLLKKIADPGEDDFFAYDLICFGIPSINWHVPAPAEQYLKAKFAQYKKAGIVVPGAPKNGRNALLFCTYSGPHTGSNEAVPAVKYAGQFFEHFGFTIADEWYVLSEFIGSEENNLFGRMGNIKGLPSEQDLLRIRQAAANLAQRL